MFLIISVIMMILEMALWVMMEITKIMIIMVL
jgi:hypothetical protein